MRTEAVARSLRAVHGGRRTDLDPWTARAPAGRIPRSGLHPAVAALCALTMLCCALLIWGAGRGYELTDEGLVLLHYAGGSEGLRAYGAIVSRVLGDAAVDLRLLRLVRLLLALGSAVVLAEGARRWLLGRRLARGGIHGILMLHCAVFMATALSYAASPQVLSYNSLNHGCLAASAGLLLCALARRESGDGRWPRLSWHLLLAGAAAGLQFFVKFPSALACAGLTVVVLLAHRVDGRAPGVHRALLAFGLGAGLAAAAFFALIEPFGSWWPQFAGNFGQATHATHAPERILDRYLWSLRLDLVRVPTHYVLSIALACAAGALADGRGVRVLRRGAIAAGCAALACYGWAVWCASAVGVAHPTHYRSSVSAVAEPTQPLQALLWMLAAAVVGCRARRWFVGLRDRGSPSGATRGARRTALVVAAFLLLLPLAGSFGTNTRLLAHAAHHLAPWAILVAWLATHLARRCGALWQPQLVLLLFAAVVQLQVIVGFALLPWRLPGHLADQTVAVRGSAALATVRVDAASAAFLSQLDRLLREHGGMQPSDPLLPLFDLPGLVRALGARYPTTVPEIGGVWDAGRVRYLESVPPPVRERTFLLIESDQAERAQRLLVQAGYAFPGSYVELGAVPNPYTGAWLTAYAPRKRIRSERMR